MPDWKKLYGDETGELFKRFSKTLYKFLAPGGHLGRFMKHDVEFALLVEHALINHVINRLKRSHLYEKFGE